MPTITVANAEFLGDRVERRTAAVIEYREPADTAERRRPVSVDCADTQDFLERPAGSRGRTR